MQQIRIESWEQAYQIPIQDCDELLVKVRAQDKIFVDPLYYQQKIKGSLADCYLRDRVYQKLCDAASFLPNDLFLKIYDGYRPFAVQQHFFDTFKQQLKIKHPELNDTEISKKASYFVSKPSINPDAPSPHITGGSVDLTLCDKTGKSLPMGSLFDEFSEKSYTHYFADNPQSIFQKNRQLLISIMTKAGFSNLPSEWWHFDYGNQLWAFFKQKKVAIYGYYDLKK